MLWSMAILVSTGPAEVNKEELSILLAFSKHHVARVQIVVNEVLKMEVLVDVEQFQGNWKSRFDA